MRGEVRELKPMPQWNAWQSHRHISCHSRTHGGVNAKIQVIAVCMATTKLAALGSSLGGATAAVP